MVMDERDTFRLISPQDALVIVFLVFLIGTLFL